MIKQNKFVSFMKKNWMYIVAFLLVIGIGVSFGLAFALSDKGEIIDVVNPKEDEREKQDEEKPEEKQEEPVVNPDALVFSMPMNNAMVIKDFSDENLQYNPTLDRWEAHMYIDLTSDDLFVYSILDGDVLSVDYDYLTGYIVKIQHKEGLVSTYSSLGEDVLVKVGDKVSTGQKIGIASNIGAGSSAYGEHLELMLTKDNQKVDPNNYLNLQSK